MLTWLKPGYIRDFCVSALLENEAGSPGGRRVNQHHGPQQDRHHFIFKWRLVMMLATE